MSKVVEKLVCHQLVAFLERLNLLPDVQSAYTGRRKHWMETAVLKVVTDVLRAADRREVSLLCMLDLSAAFDTVDHDVSIDRLRQSFGIWGLALSWIEYFLRDRTQSVCTAGQLSPSSIRQTVQKNEIGQRCRLEECTQKEPSGTERTNY